MPIRSLLVAAAGFAAIASAQQASGPDLSGVWNMQNSPQTRYLGYTFSAQEPSMTPWAQEKFKLNKPSFGPHAVEDSNDPVNPTTVAALGCFPPGVPRIYLQPFPMEIVQTQGRVLIIYEFSHLIRQVFTDGRKHNTDLGATWMGDSIGTWEGDTLVVDTIGFNDKTWLDRAGHPHSTELHVTERIRRPNFGSLDIDVTVDDPKVFTKPWTVAVHMKPLLDTEMIDFMCQDNNKDIGHFVR
jgi:hypothetical protein